MPKTKISEFSSTPASNTDIDSINIAEGCAPSGINDAIRELMAQLKDFQTGAVGDSFNGPVGTTTAAAGAFTTLSASSTVSGTGFSTYLASPPAIGGTAAAAVSATTLTTSSTVTLNGGTANGVAYLNGSKVVTSGSALTFDGSFANLTLTSGTTANGFLQFSNSADGGTQGYIGDSKALITGGANSSLAVRGESNILFGIASAEGMRLTSTGLGIGTTSPAYKLDSRVTTSASIVSAINLDASGNNNGDGSALNFSRAGNALSGVARISAVKAEVSNNETDLVFSNFAAGSLTEKMRIVGATGNVGIGTSSPATKLQVYGGALTVGDEATYAARFSNNSNKGVVIGYDTTNNVGHIGSINPATAWTDLVINANGGNLGLGVTPSANTLSKGFDLLGGAGLFGYANANYLTANTYYDGAFKYKANGFASYYAHGSGAHAWYIAASGTAGNAITFTQAATLTAGGDFLVGTTASGGQSGFAVLKGGSGIETRIEIAHNFGTASGVFYAEFLYATGRIGSISQNGTTAVAYNTSSDYRLKNITGPVTTSGAYIDSLNPVEGTWKADGSTFVGLIAHEVQEASRTQVATGTKDGAEMQGMDYSNSELIANLIAEVKSLRQRVATLEAK